MACSELLARWVGSLELKSSTVFTVEFPRSEKKENRAQLEKEDLCLEEDFSRSKYLYPLVHVFPQEQNKATCVRHVFLQLVKVTGSFLRFARRGCRKHC